MRSRFALPFAVAILLLQVCGGGLQTASASSRRDRTVTIPDLLQTERPLFDDVRDDRLDHYDAVTAALVGSNAAPEKKEKAKERWNEFVEGVVADGAGLESRAKAEFLLQRLHTNLLIGSYDFEQNDMAVALLEGKYNCVTSALAFQAAGEKMGLSVRGVLVPTHVYVRVVIGRVSFDVETTSQRGFLLAKDDAAYGKFLAEMQLDNEKRTGRKIATEGEKFYRQETDAIGLLALVYANRGAFAVRDKKTRVAIGEFARSSLLAQDERYARDSRDMLLAQAAEARILENDLGEARSLFEFAIKDPGGDPVIMQRLKENIGYCWAVEAGQKLEKKDYEGALTALDKARPWTKDPAILHNQKATYGIWGITELEAKRYRRAVEVFRTARRTFPEDKDFTRNYKAVHFDWSQSQLAANDCAGATDTARSLREAMPDDADSANLVAGTAFDCADKLIGRGDWAGASALLDDAWKIAPTPILREKISSTWTNAGVVYARAGEELKAEAAWKKAIEIDVNATAARSNLEQLQMRMRRR